MKLQISSFILSLSACMVFQSFLCSNAYAAGGIGSFGGCCSYQIRLGTCNKLKTGSKYKYECVSGEEGPPLLRCLGDVTGRCEQAQSY